MKKEQTSSPGFKDEPEDFLETLVYESAKEILEAGVDPEVASKSKSA